MEINAKHLFRLLAVALVIGICGFFVLIGIAALGNSYNLSGFNFDGVLHKIPQIALDGSGAQGLQKTGVSLFQGKNLNSVDHGSFENKILDGNNYRKINLNKPDVNYFDGLSYFSKKASVEKKCFGCAKTFIIPPKHRSDQGLRDAGSSERLILQASDAQSIIPLVEKIESLGGEVEFASAIANTLVANIPKGNVDEVLLSADVNNASVDHEMEVLLSGSFEQIKAGAIGGFGFSGKGVRVAVIDTGVDPSHLMLEGKIAAQQDFSGEGTANDLHGHGTFVAGIVSGSSSHGGEFDGVAKDSLIINAKAFRSDGKARVSSIIEAINFAINPDNNVYTDDGARVINMSFGTAQSSGASSLESTINEVESLGVIVVASSGNCGFGSPVYSCNGFTGLTFPGDLLQLNFNSKVEGSAVTVLFDSSAFEALEEGCSNGFVKVLLKGDNFCNYKIKEGSPRKPFSFTISSGKSITSRSINIATPLTIILTDSLALEQRYKNKAQVNSLMQKAYQKALENQGIVYDLNDYKNQLAPRPWSNFESYNERLDNLTVRKVNDYVESISNFIKNRCPIGYCKHVLIVGDDFVVPMGRDLSSGNVVLSDRDFVVSSKGGKYVDSLPLIDSDGDGFDDEGERLAGSLINDSTSTPFSVLKNYNLNQILGSENDYADFLDSRVDDDSFGVQSLEFPKSCGFVLGFGKSVLVEAESLAEFFIGGSIYLLTNWNNIISVVIKDFLEVVNSFSSLPPDTLQMIWSNYWRDSLVEAQDILVNEKPVFLCNTTNTYEQITFRIDYVYGKTIGYMTILYLGAFLPDEAPKINKLMQTGNLASKANKLNKNKKILKTINELTKKHGALSLKQTQSLERAIKALDAHEWTETEKKGLYILIKEAPDAQGDVVLITMKENGEWTDDMIKQAIELNADGTLKNFQKNYIFQNGKNSDAYFKLGAKEYWVESTAVQDVVRDPLPIITDLEDKSIKFAGHIGKDNTIAIRLDKGSNLSELQLKDIIISEYITHTERMNVISRVSILDAATNKVINVKNIYN